MNLVVCTEPSIRESDLHLADFIFIRWIVVASHVGLENALLVPPGIEFANS